MFDFFNSPIVRGIIGILAFGRLAFSIYNFIRSKASSEITVYLEYLSPVLNSSFKWFTSQGISFSTNYHELENVTVTSIYLQNTGKHDVTSEDFFNPIEIRIPKEFTIIDIQILSYPSSINPKIGIDKENNKLSISWELLKLKEVIQIPLILKKNTHFQNKNESLFTQIKAFSHIDLYSRIKNCKVEWTSSIPSDNPKKWWPTIILSSLVVLLISFGFFLFASNHIQVIKPSRYQIIMKNDTLIGTIRFVDNEKVLIKTYEKNRVFDLQSNTIPIKELSKLTIGPKIKRSCFDSQWFLIFLVLALAGLLHLYLVQIRPVLKKNALMKALNSKSTE